MGCAFATVPANLRDVAGTLVDPLGIGNASGDQEVDEGIFGAMTARFDGRVGAFAYLLFVLLYFPCAATIGAIVREAGRGWAAFVALWTTGVAYYTATVFYQGATFTRHPVASTLWVAALTSVLVAVVAGLRVWAGRHDDSPAPLEPVGSKA